MSSKYFPPCIVGRNNNVKVILNLSGYLRKDFSKEKRLKLFLW